MFINILIKNSKIRKTKELNIYEKKRFIDNGVKKII